MTRCKPVHEVTWGHGVACKLMLLQLQGYLRRWLDGLIPVIKDALDLWMQATVDLPCHLQHAQSEAASHLVHIAIQDAAQLMKRSQQEQLAWLSKHMPGISTVMEDCLRSHLDIVTKRISIIKSLVESNYEAVQGQIVQRLEGELEAYVLVEILGWVFFAVHPTVVVVNVLDASEAATPHLQGIQHGKRLRQQMQHSLEQHAQLIDMLGVGLQQAASICSPLSEQIVLAKHFLGRLHLLAIYTAEESVQKLADALRLHGIVCDWLVDLASTLKNLQGKHGYSQVHHALRCRLRRLHAPELSTMGGADDTLPHIAVPRTVCKTDRVAVSQIHCGHVP